MCIKLQVSFFSFFFIYFSFFFAFFLSFVLFYGFSIHSLFFFCFLVGPILPSLIHVLRFSTSIFHCSKSLVLPLSYRFDVLDSMFLEISAIFFFHFSIHLPFTIEHTNTHSSQIILVYGVRCCFYCGLIFFGSFFLLFFCWTN